MKTITPVYKTREAKIIENNENNSPLDRQKLQDGVNNLYKSMIDPNRKPVMEIFTELE